MLALFILDNLFCTDFQTKLEFLFALFYVVSWFISCLPFSWNRRDIVPQILGSLLFLPLTAASSLVRDSHHLCCYSGARITLLAYCFVDMSVRVCVSVCVVLVSASYLRYLPVLSVFLRGRNKPRTSRLRPAARICVRVRLFVSFIKPPTVHRPTQRVARRTRMYPLAPRPLALVSSCRQ